MDDLTRPALRLLNQRARAAIDMAASLRRDGTPLGTALQQAEQRIRSSGAPAGLSDAIAAATDNEQRLILDLVRRARLEPEVACPGQDPLDWLAMVLEDRARQLS